MNVYWSVMNINYYYFYKKNLKLVIKLIIIFYIKCIGCEFIILGVEDNWMCIGVLIKYVIFGLN